MRLRNLLLLLTIWAAVAASSHGQEDRDFSEFEDWEDSAGSQVEELREKAKTSTERPFDADDIAEIGGDDPEVQESDFDHFQDQEEFEGIDSPEPKPDFSEPGDKSTLKITSVPQHLSRSWQNYYLEIALMSVLAIYMFNYFSGRSKNDSIASAWLESNRSLLESNFAFVGDNGSKNIVSSYEFRKETENCFTLWCSGRQSVEGMLVELKLVKRQCLMSTIAQVVRPCPDQVSIKIILESMEPFVFCLASKKTASKTAKEYPDVVTFCGDRRQIPEKLARDFDDAFAVYAESSDLLPVIFQDQRISSVLVQFKDSIELLHVSDQYQPDRTVNNEQQLLKKPVTEMVLMMKFNLTGKGCPPEAQMETFLDLTRLCIYMAEKMSRMKLTKEARAKGEKNRQKLEEVFLKQTHLQRQELAQLRREERIRQGRERIMAEDDPEKQRKLELREQKRLAKKNNPKMKQMKVRTM